MGERPSAAGAGLLAALALGLAGASQLSAQQATQRNVVVWTAKVEATAQVKAGGEFEAVLDAVIEPGWHMYAQTQEGGGPQPLRVAIPASIAFRLNGNVIAPLPITAADANFNIDTQYHLETATFYAPVAVAAGVAGRTPLDFEITYQTCTDRFCLPPATERVRLSVLVPGSGADAQFLAAPAAPNVPTPRTRVEDMADSSDTSTLGRYLGLAAIMGALSLLTPCVFPMVPITVSYFTRRAEHDRRQALAQSLVYGAGIVLTFTGAGLVLALGFGASGLNQFAANPWLNLGIAALFIVFALNLFGAFEIALPSRLVTRAATADSGRRRYAGTLLMGLAFTLTSFTCTAPFLGTLLVVASQGSWQWPAAGLLVFSSIFALPFVLLAWAPQAVARLPKSGAWLTGVKATMGLLELAAALKFLSNVDLVWHWGVFTRSIVIALWFIIGLALVAYLAGWLRIGRAPRLSRPGPPRWIAAAVTTAFVAWMGTGLAGRRLGELEAFLPPGDLAGGQDGELTWIVNDYDGALARAAAGDQRVLVDFTGYTCTNCRWMEANMFTQPEVSRELGRYVRLRLYTDGRGEKYLHFQNLQRDTFGTVALPYYAVLSPGGDPVVAFGGLTRDRDRFVTFLQRGLR
jgi:thiol:disulfide interchange protein DsbD